MATHLSSVLVATLMAILSKIYGSNGIFQIMFMLSLLGQPISFSLIKFYTNIIRKNNFSSIKKHKMNIGRAIKVISRSSALFYFTIFMVWLMDTPLMIFKGIESKFVS